MIVRDTSPLPETVSGRALYARVSTQGQKADVERQVERLKTSAASKGYQGINVVQEIASGMNDNRPTLLKRLTDASIGAGVAGARQLGKCEHVPSAFQARHVTRWKTMHHLQCSTTRTADKFDHCMQVGLRYPVKH